MKLTIRTKLLAEQRLRWDGGLTGPLRRVT